MYYLKRENYEAFATVPNAFAPHEIEVIRTLFEKREMGTGIIATGITDKEIRDSRVHWILPHDHEMQWAFERLTAIVSTVNQQYFGMDLTSVEAIQLTEYDSEYHGFYGAHTDSSYGYEQSRYRKMSVTMQLSDPSEYEGGNLMLYPNSIRSPVTGAKERGTMTLFRSHIIHEVTPVTKGKRLSFVAWVHGPLFR